MKGHPQCSRLFDDLESLARSDREKKEMTEGFATSPCRLNADVKDAERWMEDGGRHARPVTATRHPCSRLLDLCRDGLPSAGGRPSIVP